MSNKQLWYMRRDKEIRGPFPPGLITRYILLGRILETDELSTDQTSWQCVNSLPNLIPDEMKLDLTVAENVEILRIARMREDERETVDRRNSNKQQHNLVASQDKRAGDRRSSESLDVIRHREIKTQLLESLRQKQRENYIARILGAMIVFTAILFIALSF